MAKHDVGGQLASAAGGQGEPGAGNERGEPEVEEAFDRLVSEGGDRLARPLVPLLATGFMGGIDVGVGVLASPSWPVSSSPC